ncbi:hypothetical protein ACTVZO_42110 [Streptomyces sp. IBSNAI002]|uniref:hypothetical protein n=1 Tax=Streptomyces sp. IBSNAI002 TaxID=3457500 RepID=UPI003FD3C4A8
MNRDGHEDHPLIGQLVRDIASGTEGILQAVVREALPTHTGRACPVRLAYIRPIGGGTELTTSVDNLQPLRTP